ncbi:hypothetical protein ACIQXI_04525 [Lysinibacillus sp. NPDC097195]|uniref:hypothetical protein n=1 Tax=Lysinibacillus sp. NPDC097195 TaxID=3364141 RepID=UPI0037FB9F83
MRKYILLFVMSVLLMAPAAAYAHTMDKSMVYSDVPATATNIEEIMILQSTGLIGYNGVDMALNPSENLSRKDFAAWTGAFFGLEGATVEDLAQAAKKEEYVSSLDGDITYKEINTALLHNKYEFENPDATLTKEEYIAFLSENLDMDMGGHTLLQMGGFSYGPTGTIEDVVTGDDMGVVIEGKTYMLSGHPRIFADSTEPNSWIGQKLEKSIMTTSGGHHEGHEAQSSDTPTLQYIQIASTSQQATEQTSHKYEGAATPRDEQQNNEESNPTSSSSYTLWIVAVIVLIAAIIAVFYFKRKK